VGGAWGGGRERGGAQARLLIACELRGVPAAAVPVSAGVSPRFPVHFLRSLSL
jgi:hypothetical protein